MKNTIKIILFSLITLSALLFIPNTSKAATKTVNDEATLRTAVESADPGDVISLDNNITVKEPIVIAKELVIDGNGHTVTGADSWTSTSGNQTMFTAQLGSAKLTLKDITLKNGPKYGVQSYDGATVILDNVTITGFNYGAVLVNAGNLEIKNLKLGHNGTGANNGIEIDKGSAATNNPKVVMNGTLTSESNENVVRIADNGYLTEFTIDNSDDTETKIALAGNNVVVTDANDNIISETKVPDNVTANVDEVKVILTLVANGKEEKITVDSGEKVTEKFLKSKIDVKKGYKIDGFFTDSKYTNKFNFDEAITKDTTIYVKISEENKQTQEEKDESPKTGVRSYVGASVAGIILAISSIMIIKKREN